MSDVRVSGVVSELKAFTSGWGDDKRHGYRVQVDAEFGWVTFFVEASAAFAPRIGDRVLVEVFYMDSGEEE